MNALAQDVRFAFRRLCKAPGFSLIVVVTLAFGIGATTAIFSLVEGILLRPLPFNNPNQLVLLGDHLRDGPGTSVTAREIGTYAAANGTFSSTGGYTPISLRDLWWRNSGRSEGRPVYHGRLYDAGDPSDPRPCVYTAGRGCP